LFSIQFAAPYAVALPARVFGISAPTAMTLSGIAAAFLSAVLCFFLIQEIFGRTVFSFAGALVVLCGGALFAGEGAIGEVFGTGFPYPYFPFLRRYVPAVPFPAFFMLLYAIWKLLSTEKKSSRILWCVASSLCFSFLVFSYFYIWTSAAAWMFCLFLALLICRPKEWKRHISALSALGGACLIPLCFYFYMLSQRSTAMDSVQLLVRSRALDLERTPLLIGAVVLLIVIALLIAKKTSSRSLAFVFTIVTGFVPIILFNQQVVTGLSLQPIHYQVFIGNYIAGLGLVLVGGLAFDKAGDSVVSIAKWFAAALAVFAIIWGFVECHYTVRVLDDANLARDRAFSVGAILAKEGESSPDPYRDTIFSVSNLHGDDSPTLAPQNVLWTRHQHVFAGLNWQESKERYYRQLYFADLGPDWLDGQLKNGNFVAMIALFGWGRHTDRLSSEARPLTYPEIDEEVARYKDFLMRFDRTAARSPELDYMVVPLNYDAQFRNLQNWYSRKLINSAGGYRIYRLEPK
jgi:hypothetical protein